MMKRISFIPVLITLGVIACTGKPATKQAVPEEDTTVYAVKVMKLEKQKVTQTIELTANLLPLEEIHFAPAAPGRIEEIMVEVGSRVKKGDVIARMEKTQLVQATEQLQNARTTFQRMDTLFKLKSISEQQYDGAKTQYELARSNVDFLTRNTTLLSPVNGIVTGKYFESNELYSGAPNTEAGKAAIVTLMQINPMKVVINVPEKYFPVTHAGMKATVHPEVFAGESFTGKISKVYPTINPGSRTFAVEILVDNDREKLRPGMFARVTLQINEVDALAVPAIMILKQEGTNDRYVFVAGEGNRAKKIRVETGERFNEKIEIISKDLKEGDTLISAGQEKLMDGSRISIIQ